MSQQQAQRLQYSLPTPTTSSFFRQVRATSERISSHTINPTLVLRSTIRTLIQTSGSHGVPIALAEATARGSFVRSSERGSFPQFAAPKVRYETTRWAFWGLSPRTWLIGASLGQNIHRMGSVMDLVLTFHLACAFDNCL